MDVPVSIIHIPLADTRGIFTDSCCWPDVAYGSYFGEPCFRLILHSKVCYKPLHKTLVGTGGLWNLFLLWGKIHTALPWPLPVTHWHISWGGQWGILLFFSLCWQVVTFDCVLRTKILLVSTNLIYPNALTPFPKPEVTCLCGHCVSS